MWKFTPPQYKMKHRGKVCVIPLGPKAQAVLAAFTPADPTDYFFSPRRVMADLLAERAAKRQAPRYRSHMERNRTVRRTKPERVPRDFNHDLLRESPVWESVTPFVAHRHLKRRDSKRDHLPPGADWRDEFVKLAARECMVRIAPVACEVEFVKAIDGHPRLSAFVAVAISAGRLVDSGLCD